MGNNQKSKYLNNSDLSNCQPCDVNQRSSAGASGRGFGSVPSKIPVNKERGTGWASIFFPRIYQL